MCTSLFRTHSFEGAHTLCVLWNVKKALLDITYKWRLFFPRECGRHKCKYFIRRIRVGTYTHFYFLPSHQVCVLFPLEFLLYKKKLPKSVYFLKPFLF